jgi:hypothetical protein
MDLSGRETIPERPLPTGPAPAAPPGAALGQRLGQYLLLEKLGQGGMGAVYKALHTRLKRPVALKVLPDDRPHDAQALSRFLREMEAVGKLDHPHIIRATDAGDVDGRHFLVMEFAEGADLGRVVRRCGPLAVADACELARQASLGLQCAHAHGLVHRDVKPSNLLLTAAGQVKVLDLGLARLYEEPPPADRITDSGQIMGTADYMAPEQAFDSHRVDGRADTYSLGCTLYKLLSGQAPFAGPEYDSRMKKLLAHAQAPVPDIRAARPDLPEGVAAVLDRMLAKAPADRFATPAEVAEALRPFAEGSRLPELAARAAAAGEGPPAVPAAERVDTRSHEAPTPAPRGAPPASGRRRRGLRLWPVGAVLLLGAALVAALLARGTGRLPTRGAVPPAAPGTWQDLLGQRPRPLLWQEGPDLASWAFDAGSRRLEVHCQGTALFRLGTEPSAPYKVQLGIQQTRWQGGVGLFLGFAEEEFEGRRGYRYQRVELAPYSGPDGQGFQLCRTLARYRLRDGTAVPFRTERLASQRVPAPLPHEYFLEITIEERGLTFVRWGGEALPNLVLPAVERGFGPDAYRGPFGTFSDCSDGVFRNAQFMTLK